MVTEEEKIEILRFDGEGLSLRGIEEKTGIPKSTVQKVLKEKKNLAEENHSVIEASSGVELTVNVFKLLEDGSTLPQIVIKLEADPDEVQRLYDKWLGLTEMDVNQPNLEEIYEDLDKLNVFLGEARGMGAFKRSGCTHFESDGFCYGLTYTTGFGSSVHRKPTALKCALCPVFSTE